MTFRTSYLSPCSHESDFLGGWCFSHLLVLFGQCVIERTIFPIYTITYWNWEGGPAQQHLSNTGQTTPASVKNNSLTRSHFHVSKDTDRMSETSWFKKIWGKNLMDLLKWNYHTLTMRHVIIHSSFTTHIVSKIIVL